MSRLSLEQQEQAIGRMNDVIFQSKSPGRYNGVTL